MPVGIDIYAELNVIATERYGSLVKKAVHDAIEKVNSNDEEKNDGPKLISREFEGAVATNAEYATLETNDIGDTYAIGDVVVEVDPLQVNMMQLTWEKRKGRDATGEFYDNPNNRLVCVDYIEIPDNCTNIQIVIMGDYSAYDYYAFYYDDNHVYLGVSTYWRATSMSPARLFPDAKYVRFGFRKHNNDTFSFNSIWTCVAIFSTQQTESTYSMTSLMWENRNGNDSTGEFYNNPANRLVCVDYIPIPSGYSRVEIALFTFGAMFYDYVYFYDSNKHYLGVIDYYDMPNEFQIMQDAAFARFGFKRDDGSNLNAQIVKACIACFR